MAFERTKEASESHSEEEVQEETNDLKPDEETSAEVGHQEEENSDSEEDTSTNEELDENSAEYWKTKAQKMEEERDNYKQGMLSAKAKKRSLDIAPVVSPKVDLNESAVLEVLGKQSEKKALQNTIDSKHPDYIPELVDDSKYNEILAYLPRNMDKGDYESIVRSLKLATRLWREDKGIKSPTQKKNSIPGSKTTQVSGQAPSKPQQFERKFLKTQPGMENWYVKK